MAAWIKIPTLSFTRVTLDKLLSIADTQFPICKMGLTIPTLQSSVNGGKVLSTTLAYGGLSEYCSWCECCCCLE